MITKIPLYNLFILLVLCSALPAQIKVHKHISTKDGLAQGQINVMMQDSKGYLWFGTYGGISRWDGKEFLNITTFNGLTASQVMDIEEGKDSSIYIAPYGGGIVVFKDGNLDTLNEGDGLSTNWMSEIFVLENGDVLFGGYEGNISILKKGKLDLWIDPTRLNKKSVWEIYRSKDSTFYIGTYMGGFFTYKNNIVKNFSTRKGLNNNNVWAFEETGDGSIYVGTHGGINLF